MRRLQSVHAATKQERESCALSNKSYQQQQHRRTGVINRYHVAACALAK